MFDFKLKDEDILMKLTARRPVSHRDVFCNVFGNMVTRAGGDIALRVDLILTKESLYIHYIGHASIGFAKETREVVELKLEDILNFKVESDESREVIEIETEKRLYNFIIDTNDGLALAMSRIIQEEKH